MQLGAEMIIFDQDLTPGQARAISDFTEVKVVGLRRRIAEKMALSKSRIPHITIVEDPHMLRGHGSRPFDGEGLPTAPRAPMASACPVPTATTLTVASGFTAATGNAGVVVQAARIVNPPFQRTVVMAMAKFKGPARAVSAVASRIVNIVDDMAAKGMWRAESQAPAAP